MKFTACTFFLMGQLALSSIMRVAFADDAPVEIAAGGLEFKKVAQVTMDHEDLTISKHQVQVSYLFTNHSDKDLTTEVAFPIPPYEWTVTISSTQQPAFLDFQAESNGEKIKPQIDVHAIYGGHDVTSLLKKLNIPLLNIDKAYEVIQKFNREDRQELITLKLVQSQGRELWPNWVMHVNFHWTQTFPAQQPIRITHVYTPHTGGRLECPSFYKEITDACLGADDQPRIAKMITTLSPNKCAYLTKVKFILKTANNWGGPIKEFRLKIKKRPDEFVGMCGWRFLQKTVTDWDAELYDFAPSDDLIVYFVSPPLH